MSSSSTNTALNSREGFSGACYQNGKPICVHREESYCDEGTFHTAHFLRANPGHDLRLCTHELSNVVIGRCGNGTDAKCSNNADRCDDMSSFLEYDTTCTVVLDISNETPTIYGKCDERCVWSQEDCQSGESFVKWAPECTSDKVQIGACWAGHAFCAVSEKSCVQEGQPYEPYLTHQETKDQIGVTCILSYIPTEDELVDTVVEQVPSQSPSLTTSLASETSGLSTGATVGLVTGAAIVTGLVVGIVAYYFGSRSALGLSDKETTKTASRPMPSVEILDQSEGMGNHVKDDDELSDL